MKYIAALCLLAVALGAPQGRNFIDHPYEILRSDVEHSKDGVFRFGYETENGIEEEREGSPGSEGQTNMSGFYQFPLPNGEFAVVTWVADENGFRAESPLIPVDHPLPAHAVEQIRFAEEQRSAGVQF